MADFLLIQGNFKKKEPGGEDRAPQGLSEKLREMADQVDRGEITEMVATYDLNGEYEHVWACSPALNVTLSTLQTHEAVAMLKGED